MCLICATLGAIDSTQEAGVREEELQEEDPQDAEPQDAEPQEEEPQEAEPQEEEPQEADVRSKHNQQTHTLFVDEANVVQNVKMVCN